MMNSQILVQQLAQLNLRVFAIVPGLHRYEGDRPVLGISKVSIKSGSKIQSLVCCLQTGDDDAMQILEDYQDIDTTTPYDANRYTGSPSIIFEKDNSLSCKEIIEALGTLSLPVYVIIDNEAKKLVKTSFAYIGRQNRIPVGLAVLLHLDQSEENAELHTRLKLLPNK